MMPVDQMSTLTPYGCPRISSGAIQYGVPTTVSRWGGREGNKNNKRRNESTSANETSQKQNASATQNQTCPMSLSRKVTTNTRKVLFLSSPVNTVLSVDVGEGREGAAADEGNLRLGHFEV